jgi:hypothetical protein
MFLSTFHSSQFPVVDAGAQVPFIPPSPPRSPFAPPQSVGHHDSRGGAGSSPTGVSRYPEMPKRARRKVADVRRGGKWEDLLDAGSDLEEKVNMHSRRPSAKSSTKSMGGWNGKLGVEVSLDRVVERLAQVGDLL